MKRARAIFLDRDGVLNEILFFPEVGVLETPFHPRHLKLLPGVPQAVREINRMGFKAIVISNQPGVGMGHFSLKALERITAKLQRLLRNRGAYLDRIYYCLHHPLKGKSGYKKRCVCRKPKPGLFFRASRELGIDLKRSYVVGDSIIDVEAGRKAGCKTILLGHAKCDLCRLMAKRGIRPHWVAKDLGDAVSKIRRLDGKARR